MLLLNSCQRTRGLLPCFHFKTGTVLGKLGQAGLIRAPHCSLRVEPAELLLSCKVPVVRGWAEAWKISLSVLLQHPKGVCSIAVSWTLLPACLLPLMAHRVPFTGCSLWGRGRLVFVHYLVESSSPFTDGGTGAQRS